MENLVSYRAICAVAGCQIAALLLLLDVAKQCGDSDYRACDAAEVHTTAIPRPGSAQGCAEIIRQARRQIYATAPDDADRSAVPTTSWGEYRRRQSLPQAATRRFHKL